MYIKEGMQGICNGIDNQTGILINNLLMVYIDTTFDRIEDHHK